MASEVGAVGADTYVVASSNLAENLTEDIRIVNDDTLSNQPTQQSAGTAADTAAECPDPTGHPIPLTPSDSASPGRHGSAERTSSKRRSRAATQSPQRLSGPRRDSSAGLIIDESQGPRRLLSLNPPESERIRELEVELSDVKTKMADLEHFIYNRQTSILIDESQAEVKKLVD